MKGVGRETSFHPRLICPVAAEPEDGDALMSKSVCVWESTTHTGSSRDAKSFH